MFKPCESGPHYRNIFLDPVPDKSIWFFFSITTKNQTSTVLSCLSLLHPPLFLNPLLLATKWPYRGAQSSGQKITTTKRKRRSNFQDKVRKKKPTAGRSGYSSIRMKFLANMSCVKIHRTSIWREKERKCRLTAIDEGIKCGQTAIQYMNE